MAINPKRPKANPETDFDDADKTVQSKVTLVDAETVIDSQYEHEIPTLYAHFDLTTILAEGVRLKASDIHLQVGHKARIRVYSEIQEIPGFVSVITPDDTKTAAAAILNERQKQILNEQGSIDARYDLPQLARFRFNFSLSGGDIVIAVRILPLQIPTFQSLNLPVQLETFAKAERGLILVVGATGSGKSSTIAAMINYINQNFQRRIITLEDPIEYYFDNGEGLITQKQLGIDIPNFHSALKMVLRQDPDVLMIGEIRDKETLEATLAAAETGHLVISTLHTKNAPESINRILSYYDGIQQEQIRQRLASALLGVIAQRLIPQIKKRELIPLVEIMVVNERIRKMLTDPSRTREISNAIADGQITYGMQTFDQGLVKLLEVGMISFDTALNNATTRTDFEVKYGHLRETGSVEALQLDHNPPMGPSAQSKTPRWYPKSFDQKYRDLDQVDKIEALQEKEKKFRLDLAARLIRKQKGKSDK